MIINNKLEICCMSTPTNNTVQKLCDMIFESIVTHEQIDTKLLPRACGKTTALIKVAECMGFGVIVNSKDIALGFRKDFGYPNIFGKEQDWEMSDSGMTHFLVDECITKDHKSNGLTNLHVFKEI